MPIYWVDCAYEDGSCGHALVEADDPYTAEAFLLWNGACSSDAYRVDPREAVFMALKEAYRMDGGETLRSLGIDTDCIPWKAHERKDPDFRVSDDPEFLKADRFKDEEDDEIDEAGNPLDTVSRYIYRCEDGNR